MSTAIPAARGEIAALVGNKGHQGAHAHSIIHGEWLLARIFSITLSRCFYFFSTISSSLEASLGWF
jgi:hypothetical protein